MDLGKSSEKFEAMKNQKKGGCFIYNLMLYSVAGLACSLFWSYPYWFSSLGCSMNQFLFIYFPYICSSFCNPKCLFIIANVIIVFLVAESNFLGSSANSSPAGDFYDEYVERRRRTRVTSAGSTFPQKKEEKKRHVQVKLIEQKSVNTRVDEVKDVMRRETEKDEEKEKEREEEEEEEEGALPAEELNKRVEEFIARVNKQRWLEAKSLVCYRA